MAADPIVFSAPNFFERNSMPDQYAGMLVLVAYDAAYPSLHPEDPSSNPTGRIYRLRPLAECDLSTNAYGNDDTHWELNGSGQITAVLGGSPLRIMGGGASEASFPPAARHFGTWRIGE